MGELTVGSLFAGIGGFDLGLERAGMRSVWQSEIDPYCQRVLARHWPDVLRVPDVRDVGAGTVPAVDVICGGFPCQDLSYAGAGAGIDGARSGLWSEYARVVGELRPRYVVVENVAALLARGLGRVLGDLAALGYDAEWDCIPASAVGAPQRRDRLWLVAYPSRDAEAGAASSPGTVGERARAGGQPVPCPDADGRGLKVCGERDGGPDRPEQPASQRRDADGFREAVADADEGRRARRAGERRPGRRGEPTDGRAVADAPQRPGLASIPRPSERAVPQGDGGLGRHWAVEPDVGRVAHGVPARVDRLAALGNALVPQIAEWIGRRIIDHEETRVAA